MVKHTQTICELLPTNYLSVFDHFVWLALKGLNTETTDETYTTSQYFRFSSAEPPQE